MFPLIILATKYSRLNIIVTAANIMFTENKQVNVKSVYKLSNSDISVPFREFKPVNRYT